MPRRPMIICPPIRILASSGAEAKLSMEEPNVPKQGPTLLIIETEALTEVTMSSPKAA